MKYAPTLLALSAVVLAACSNGNGDVGKIKARIATFNYCSADDECTVVDSKCPFDCYIPTNASHRLDVEGLLDDYVSSCTYSCTPKPSVRCIENQCVFAEVLPQ
jgi:hypothetical protein